MTYTPIAPGTPDWDVPVNAAFVDQDSRIDSLQVATSDLSLMVNGKVSKVGDTMSGTLGINQASSSSFAVTTSQLGDTNDRFALRGSGIMEWGDGTATRDTSIQRASTASLRITPTANASASTSAGGALNITNTSSTGAGVVVYSNQAAPTGHLIASRADSATFNQAAIYAEHHGTSHSISVNHQGTGAGSSAANLASNNTANSALQVSGVESGRGTIKVSHTLSGAAGSDANASALSIDLQGAGTAAQGVFITSTTGPTTGALVHARNGGTGALVEIPATGGVSFGSGTGPTDASITRTGVGSLRSSGQFATPALSIFEGSNARMGTATLVAGTATVANTSVAANDRIFLTSQVDGGTPGFLRVSTRTAGTSFTITSSSATDTSTVAWMIVRAS